MTMLFNTTALLVVAKLKGSHPEYPGPNNDNFY